MLCTSTGIHCVVYLCVFVPMQVCMYVLGMSVCVSVCLYACTLVMWFNVVVSLQNDENEDDGVSCLSEVSAEVLCLACHLWEWELALRHNPMTSCPFLWYV